MPSPKEVLNAAGFDGAKFEYSDASLTSMRGPCPRCGGSRRLLIFIDNPTPNWNFECDICKLKGATINLEDEDLLGLSLASSKEKKDYTAALEELANSRKWLDYHLALDDNARAWYRNRGIPDAYQDHWALGYVQSRPFLHDGQVYRSPAYSIPKLSYDFDLVNIDYRLVELPDPKAGKYRSEMGIPPAPFIASPATTDQEQVFIVEGAFKAMVLYIFLEENGMTSQVVGLPSVSSKLYMDHVFRYPKAYILLDPDSPDRTKAVVRETGATPVYLPVKVDDAILAGMTWSEFRSVITYYH